MSELIALLRPRLLSFKNGGDSRSAGNRRIRYLLFSAIGIGFWIGAFLIFYRVLSYFQGIEEFGDVLARKLLSMVLLTFFSLLLFSSIVSSLSKLYLSRDLLLVHSLPVAGGKIFLARWLESTADSSWMVIVFSLPVFLSYGIVYQAGPFFYWAAGMALIALCLIASALSALAVVVAAVLLPAGRIRTVFVFFGLLLIMALIFAFRLMRPERLVNPETFATLVLYLREMGMPGSPLLPSTWAFDSLNAALSGHPGESLFHLSLAWSCAAALAFMVTWAAAGLYFAGYTKAQTTVERLFPLRGGRRRLLARLSGPAGAFAVKEYRTFFRDQTQWPQLFLIAALIVIYLYNFSVLPLGQSKIKTIYLQNIFSFLNMGLAAFVLTAVAARFVYPAVSFEGDAFWIVRAAPLPLRTFLWVKFSVYYLPLLVLAEILIVSSNILLQVTTFMMALSVVTVFLMVPGVVALGIGLGAAYPDFQSENPSQSVTSFGGLLFMLLAAGFIAAVIVLEAGPVYAVFMANLHGRTLSRLQWVWLVASFALVVLLCILAVILPMRLGERRLRGSCHGGEPAVMSFRYIESVITGDYPGKNTAQAMA
ncbi:MAG: putative ABC transporter permease subunit [Syntrophales bacterium]